MAKVWFCRSGIIAHSCGVEPFTHLSLSECKKILGLSPAHLKCALSEIEQRELVALVHTGSSSRASVVMGQNASFADPEHVLVTVEESESTQDWKAGVYHLPQLSPEQARERLHCAGLLSR
jgi:ABC-type bacteriocin/lantibiotic exporter with double-glycine peptidase domain